MSAHAANIGMAHRNWNWSRSSLLVVFTFARIHCSESASTASGSLPPPNCTLLFHEDGHYDLLHNVTEVEPNTFVVKLNETNTKSMWATQDGEYLSSLFSDGELPPYARFSCQTRYPIDFEFEGVGALDFFQVRKSQTKQSLDPGTDCKTVVEPNCTLYNTFVDALLIPQATGKYIFYSTADKNLSTSYFIFAEAKSKPYLIGASSSSSHMLRPKRIWDAGSGGNSTTVTLPCVTSNYNVTVNLYLQVLRNGWLTVRYKSVKYDPKQGFIGTLKPGFKTTDFIPGVYKCSTGDELDPDYVIVDVNPEPPKAHNETEMSLSFVNKTAICRTSRNSAVRVEMSNAYSRNPTESRLLTECLLKGNSYCGSHSYHQRKIAGPLFESECHLPNCAQIQDVHPEGLVYCSKDGENAVKEYFTGLDGIIYTDWKSAPTHALMRPIIMSPHDDSEYKLKPEGSDFLDQVYRLRTGTGYYLQCEAVGLLIKEPSTMNVKYSNGSIHSTFETFTWPHGTHFLYLTPNMTEISCSDRMWTTNEVMTTSVHIIVEDFDCGPKMFKCESTGMCRIGETVCDGTPDCADGSDEKKSRCEEFRPVLTRFNQEVTFVPHARNDLICELAKTYPEHLRPTLEWVRNGTNITDKQRVWKGLDGHNILLRFTDVCTADEGEYTCVARNKLGEDRYTVKITVHKAHGRSTGGTSRPPTLLPTSTERTTSSTKRTQGTPTSPRRDHTSLKPTSVPTIHVADHSHSHHFHAEHDPTSDSGGGTPTSPTLTAGVVIIVLVIVVTLIGGTFIAWTHYKRIPASRAGFSVGLSTVGASRMQTERDEDREQIMQSGNE